MEGQVAVVEGHDDGQQRLENDDVAPIGLASAQQLQQVNDGHVDGEDGQ